MKISFGPEKRWSLGKHSNDKHALVSWKLKCRISRIVAEKWKGISEGYMQVDARSLYPKGVFFLYLSYFTRKTFFTARNFRPKEDGRAVSFFISEIPQDSSVFKIACWLSRISVRWIWMNCQDIPDQKSHIV